MASRKKFAAAVVDLLEMHSVAEVAQVAAHELVRSRSTRELDLLINDISAELLRRHGQLEVTVTATHDVPAALKEHLITFLKKRTHATSVSMTTQINPTLLGGLRATTPVGELDWSLASQLNQLKTS